MKNQSKIELLVSLNENNVPESIQWNAPEAGQIHSKAEAFFLSIWDPKEKNTLRIDLWTPQMTVEEMKQFFHQTLVAMADTFQRATADEKMSDTMRDFCDYFAEKLELKKE